MDPVVATALGCRAPVRFYVMKETRARFHCCAELKGRAGWVGGVQRPSLMGNFDPCNRKTSSAEMRMRKIEIFFRQDTHADAFATWIAHLQDEAMMTALFHICFALEVDEPCTAKLHEFLGSGIFEIDKCVLPDVKHLDRVRH